MTQSSKMTPYVSAGSVTNAELRDDGGIVQSALLQIVRGFRMAVELKLIESGRLLQQLGNRRGRRGHQLLFQMRHTLAKGQIQEELDKADQVAAPTTAVAVEQIFSGIDVEGRTSLLMQRTQPDQFLPRAGTTRLPVVALQILQ